MKKIEYQAPEMEVIELNMQGEMLSVIVTSGDQPGMGGDADESDTF